MAFNLRNRSFLKEIDFEPRGAALPARARRRRSRRAKYAGTETPRLDGKEIALIFEKTSTRTRSAFEVAAFDQGAHVTYLDPSGSQLGPQGVDRRHRRACWAGCTTPSSSAATAQADVESWPSTPGCPVYNGLTDEWHPTQMLADFLTMHESSGKPYDGLTYAYVGDCRFNMGRSLLVMGALMGCDVRLAGPPEPAAAQGRRRPGRGHRRSHRRTAHAHRRSRPKRSAESTSSTPTCGCRWASPRTCGRSGSSCCAPYQINAALLERTGNRPVKFMHCLPAFHDTNTVVGREIMEHTGMTDGLEVTDEVFESDASIVFDQAENRLHTIKAILVATLA